MALSRKLILTAIISGFALVACAIALGIYFPLHRRKVQDGASMQSPTGERNIPMSSTFLPTPSPQHQASILTTAPPTTRTSSLRPTPLPTQGFGSVRIEPVTSTPTGSSTTSSPSSSIRFVPPTQSPSSSRIAATTLAPTTTTTTAPLICNGLANLCDQPVNEVMFATVHNAGSTLEDGIATLHNHELNFTNALLAGYRGLNFDIGICENELRLVHSFCFLGHTSLTTALNALVDFLEENPNEVVIMPTELVFKTGGSFSVSGDVFSVIAAAAPRFLAYLYPFNGDAWPTLRELIQIDRRILFFHYGGQDCSESPCPDGFHNWFDFAMESAFSFPSTEAALERPAACEITRGLFGRGDFYGVNVFTAIPTCGQGASPLHALETLQEHIAQCALVTGRNVNLVLVDCWDDGDSDVLQVVQEYNAGLM